MGREVCPDLSVQISRRRWRCVLDPLLCLSHGGPAFARGLAPHAEVWLAPEFHHILDSWVLYDQKPDLLTQSLGGSYVADEIRDALRLWLRLREESSRLGGRLYWVRDSLRESCLPSGMEESVLPRWEAMAEALDERLSKVSENNGPVVAAMRDAVALSAALPGALLLTLRQPAKSGLAPAVCRHLQAWGLSCRRLDIDDDLVTLERSLLLRVLVEAGLAGFLWSGMGLAVMHLVVPGDLSPGHGYASNSGELDFLTEDGEPRPLKNAWEDARAFWYHVAVEDAHA